MIGVDTAADEPNGYPVWISPFISGVRTGAPKTMDFLGTATWSASESPILAGCLVIDFMLGTGVAIYDNPLPVGLGSLIDVVGTPSPQLEALQTSVDAAGGERARNGHVRTRPSTRCWEICWRRCRCRTSREVEAP